MSAIPDETFDHNGKITRETLPMDMMSTILVSSNTRGGTAVHMLYGYGYRHANASEAFLKDLEELGQQDLKDFKALQTFCGQWLHVGKIQGFEHISIHRICMYCLRQAAEKFLMMHEHYVGGGYPNRIVRGLVILYPLVNDQWIEGLRKIKKEDRDAY